MSEFIGITENDHEVYWYDDGYLFGPKIGTPLFEGYSKFRGLKIPPVLCPQFVFSRTDKPLFKHSGGEYSTGWLCQKHKDCVITACPDMLSWWEAQEKPEREYGDPLEAFFKGK